MTARLVLLMSSVLLLTLAAFALLVSRTQERVMVEVARMASAVGRATLLDLDVEGGESGTLPRAGRFVRIERAWTARVGPEKVTREAGGTPVGQGTSQAGPTGEPTTEPDPDAEDAPSLLTAHGDPRVVALPHARAFAFRALHPGEVPAAIGDGGIRVEDVQAESRPDGKVLLRITTVRHAPRGEEAEKVVEEVVRLHRGGPVAEAPALPAGPPAGSAVKDPALGLVRHEVLLPVPTRDLDAVFSGTRQRSLLLFLGVFLVGTIATAAVATHFTRPIRRLDAALRRLGEGELDVVVDARGGDEVARLGAAFNEMARRLRAGREREREMTRREKLSSLGRLAAGVAHDVRNPLHSIGLTLEHVRESCRPAEPDAQRELDRSLSLIREEIRRLDRLVENFLRFARSGERELRPTDLERLARETILLVGQEAARRGIETEVRTEGAVPSVLADAESVRAAVLNLVLNSLEAMPGGGRLSIAVGGEEGCAVLEVSDTGGGIREEDQERVFEFSWTTREGGHGLGLAMVHQVVVEEHGGRVTLTSRPGAGTRVRLRLPSLPADGAAAPSAPAPLVAEG